MFLFFVFFPPLTLNSTQHNNEIDTFVNAHIPFFFATPFQLYFKTSHNSQTDYTLDPNKQKQGGDKKT